MTADRLGAEIERSSAVSEGKEYGQEPAGGGWFRVRLDCLSEESAVAAAEYLFGKGVPWTKQAGAAMETILASPALVMQWADDAVERRWAADAEAAQMIARMSDDVDRARAAARG